jgi:hypothetical protein
MPNRILRDGILDSELVDKLQPQAEVLYRRLMSVHDDFGRFDARPLMVRSKCYPLRADSIREADIARLLAEVQQAGLIALYEVDGKSVGTFFKCDKPRANASKFPPMPGHASTCRHLRADACTCQHMRPYSDSYSDSNTSASTVPPPASPVQEQVKAQSPQPAEPQKPEPEPKAKAAPSESEAKFVDFERLALKAINNTPGLSAINASPVMKAKAAAILKGPGGGEAALAYCLNKLSAHEPDKHTGPYLWSIFEGEKKRAPWNNAGELGGHRVNGHHKPRNNGRNEVFQ